MFKTEDFSLFYDNRCDILPVALRSRKLEVYEISNVDYRKTMCLVRIPDKILTLHSAENKTLQECKIF